MKTLESGRFNNSNYLEENGEGRLYKGLWGNIGLEMIFCDSVSEGGGAITIKIKVGFSET